MHNKMAFEWPGLEELLLVSGSRLALKLSGCRAYIVATPAISLKSVHVETRHGAAFVRCVTSSFMLLMKPHSFYFVINHLSTKQVNPWGCLCHLVCFHLLMTLTHVF